MIPTQEGKVLQYILCVASINCVTTKRYDSIKTIKRKRRREKGRVRKCNTTKRYGKGETIKRNQSGEARKRPNSSRNKERNTTKETTLRLKRGEATNFKLEKDCY